MFFDYLNLSDSTTKKKAWIYEGYSDYWRRNKSAVEATELANTLRALRKVAGQIGTNIGGVEWAGMQRTDLMKRGIVTLDPSFIMGDYPVPPGKMDVLVGIVTHESLHRKEWSDLVWTEMDNASKNLAFLDKDILWKLYEAAEDIYIDKLAGRNVLGLYTDKVRAVLSEEVMASPFMSPIVEMLFDLWKRRVLDGWQENEINPLYQEPLDILTSRMMELVNKIPLKGSVSKRCRARSSFYLEIWEAVRHLISPWMREEITYFGERLESTGPKQKVKAGGKKGKGATKEPLPLELQAEIEASLAAGSADITPLIRNICNDDPEVITTSLWDFTIPAHPVIDPYLVARLRGIFFAYASRITVVNRGLESGKIDKSRLYRAPITKRCFLQKHLIPDMTWNIAVLVDASQSMEGSKWRVVENVFSSFNKALEGQKNQLKVLGYFEHDGICIVSELIRGGEVYSIPPAGRTPSGQAILAAALLMPKSEKRRFIIHITDGESNCGCDVKYALEYCKKMKIDLVTLGCGYRDRETLTKQYGSSLEFLDYFEQLPKSLENLLRRKLLYASK